MTSITVELICSHNLTSVALWFLYWSSHLASFCCIPEMHFPRKWTLFSHLFLCSFKYHLSRSSVTALFKTSYLLPIYLYSMPALFFPWHFLTPKIQNSALLFSFSLLPLSPNVSFKKLGFLFTFYISFKVAQLCLIQSMEFSRAEYWSG